MIQRIVDTDKLNDAIIVQAQLCRDLKSANASKDSLGIAVIKLICFKKRYKDLTGTDWLPSVN